MDELAQEEIRTLKKMLALFNQHNTFLGHNDFKGPVRTYGTMETKQGIIVPNGVFINMGGVDAIRYLTDHLESYGPWQFKGDVTFVGSGVGLPYGFCGGDEIGWSQASAVQNQWYLISDADINDGPLNLVTHDGNGKLTLTVAGTYQINWAGALEVSGANVHLQVGISVSGGAPAASVGMVNHWHAQGANAEGPISGCGLVTVAANATIELAARTTDTGTPTISCDHYMLSAVMVGG